MSQGLVERVKALLDGTSEEERRAIVDALVSDLRRPSAYMFEELDGGTKVALTGTETATAEADKRRWGRRAFDLDFELRRRETWKWLAHDPPPPRDFPEGMGEDSEYPCSLGGTLF
jgi:hypothetical protein